MIIRFKKSRLKRFGLFNLLLVLTILIISSNTLFADAPPEQSNPINHTSGSIVATVPYWNIKEVQQDDDVFTEIKIINNSVLELNISAKYDLAQNYKWDMAICNISGVNNLKYMEEDAQGGFEFATEINVNHDKLSNYGLPSSWCPENNNEGYILFSSGSKSQLPEKFRLIFDSSENKEVKIYYGSGTGVTIATATTSGRNTLYSTRNSSGDLFVTYVDSGNLIISTSADKGATWTPTTVLSSGAVNNPSIGIDSKNQLIIVAMESDGTNDQIIFLNKTDNVWNPPKNLTGGADFNNPVSAFNESDGLVVCYGDSTNTAIQCNGTTDLGLNWQGSVPDNGGAVAGTEVYSTGTHYLAWYYYGNEWSVRTSKDGFTWSGETNVITMGGSASNIHCQTKYANADIICAASRTSGLAKICTSTFASTYTSWSCNTLFDGASRGVGIIIPTLDNSVVYGIVVNDTGTDSMEFLNSSEPYTTSTGMKFETGGTASINVRGSRYPAFNNASTIVDAIEYDIMDVFWFQGGNLLYRNITVEVEVIDTTAPTYSNQQINTTKYNNDSAYQINRTATDADNNVAYCNMSTNLTSGRTWVNFSNQTFGSSPVKGQMNISTPAGWEIGDVAGFMLSCCDDQTPENCGSDAVQTFTLISSAPIITILSPTNNSASSDNSPTIGYSVDETSNCSILINGTTNNSMNNIGSGNHNLTFTSGNGTVKIELNCTDIEGNVRTSPFIVMSISYADITHFAIPDITTIQSDHPHLFFDDSNLANVITQFDLDYDSTRPLNAYDTAINSPYSCSEDSKTHSGSKFEDANMTEECKAEIAWSAGFMQLMDGGTTNCPYDNCTYGEIAYRALNTIGDSDRLLASTSAGGILQRIRALLNMVRAYDYAYDYINLNHAENITNIEDRIMKKTLAVVAMLTSSGTSWAYLASSERHEAQMVVGLAALTLPHYNADNITFCGKDSTTTCSRYYTYPDEAPFGWGDDINSSDILQYAMDGAFATEPSEVVRNYNPDYFNAHFFNQKSTDGVEAGNAKEFHGQYLTYPYLVAYDFQFEGEDSLLFLLKNMSNANLELRMPNDWLMEYQEKPVQHIAHFYMGAYINLKYGTTGDAEKYFYYVKEIINGTTGISNYGRSVGISNWMQTALADVFFSFWNDSLEREYNRSGIEDLYKINQSQSEVFNDGGVAVFRNGYEPNSSMLLIYGNHRLNDKFGFGSYQGSWQLFSEQYYMVRELTGDDGTNISGIPFADPTADDRLSGGSCFKGKWSQTAAGANSILIDNYGAENVFRSTLMDDPAQFLDWTLTTDLDYLNMEIVYKGNHITTEDICGNLDKIEPTGITVNRHFIFPKDFVIIVDKTKGANNSHIYSFNMWSDVSDIYIGENNVNKTEGSSILETYFITPVNIGEHSGSGDELIKANITAVNVTFVSVHYPRTNKSPNMTVTILSAINGIAGEINISDFTNVITVRNDTNDIFGNVSVGSIITNSSISFMERSGNIVNKLFLTDGKSYMFNDITYFNSSEKVLLFLNYSNTDNITGNIQKMNGSSISTVDVSIYTTVTTSTSLTIDGGAVAHTVSGNMVHFTATTFGDLVFEGQEEVDTTPPTISSTAINSPATDLDIAQVNITTSDDLGVATIWLANNATPTGDWQNISSVNYTPGVATVLWSWNYTAEVGTIQHQFTVIDENGNSVQSSLELIYNPSDFIMYDDGTQVQEYGGTIYTPADGDSLTTTIWGTKTAGTFVYDDDGQKSGSMSINLLSGSPKWSTIGADLTQVTLESCFYDSLDTSGDGEFLNYRDSGGARDMSLGVQSAISTTKYTYLWTGQATTATAITRTEGWHCNQIEIGADYSAGYIDRIFVINNTAGDAMDDMYKVQTTISDLWFDNESIWNGSIPDKPMPSPPLLYTAEVGDAAPVLDSTSINNTTPKINEVIQLSVNVTDDVGISSAWYANNITGELLNKSSINISGTLLELNYSVNITNTLSRGNVVASVFTFNDTIGSIVQTSEILWTVENTPPTQPNIVNTSGRFYNTNQTFNITPSTDADLDTITYSWFYNLTDGSYVYIGVGTTLTNWTTNLTDGTYGILVNVSDASVNVSSEYFNFTIDSVIPIVNTTLNQSLTSIYQNNIINISANITDAVGLSSCQIIINQSGSNEIVTISLGGATSAQCSNKSKVTVAVGNVINYTIRVNDTSGNWRTNDTIITVGGSVINTVLNKTITNILQGDIINISATITNVAGLSFCQILINQSGPDNMHIINVSLDGATSAQCSNKSKVVLSAGGVINYTIRVNDTNNYWISSDNIITVAAVEVPSEETPSDGGGGTGNEGGGLVYVQEQQQEILTLTEGCKEDLPFTKRIFSKCKILDNGICDDGETFLMDDDCNLTQEDITTGKILEYMWLLRFVMLLSIFFLATNNKRLSFAVITLILLLIYNGAFVLIETETSVIETLPINPNIEEMSCMDVNFFINFGQCSTPDNPILGWSIAFIVIVVLFVYINGRRGKRN